MAQERGQAPKPSKSGIGSTGVDKPLKKTSEQFDGQSQHGEENNRSTQASRETGRQTGESVEQDKIDRAAPMGQRGNLGLGKADQFDEQAGITAQNADEGQIRGNQEETEAETDLDPKKQSWGNR